MKKVKWILCVLLCAIVVFLCFETYLYFNPVVELNIGRPVDGREIDSPVLRIDSKCIFGISKDVEEHLLDYSVKVDPLYRDIITEHRNLQSLHMNVSTEKNSTLICFDGQSLNDDNSIDTIHEEIVLDYRLFTNIVYE